MRDLAEILIERGLVSAEASEAAAGSRAQGPAEFASALVRAGAVAEDDLLEAVAERTLMTVLAAEFTPSLEDVRETARAIGADVGWMVRNEVIAWRGPDGVLCAAGPRLFDAALGETIEQWRAGGVRQFLVRSAQIEPILIALAGDMRGASSAQDASRLYELAEEAPVVDFVNSVFAEALALRASDVHFEPFEGRTVVRTRVDGVLSQRRAASREMFDAVASRIKLLSGMDIAERRLPQDGRQSIHVAGRDIDVRVSTLPTKWGESVVVRLLGTMRRIPALEELGMSEQQIDALMSTIKQPHGLVLLTGPTGSGKTTTVYRLLAHLNDGVRKIVTIEDPVEIDLPGLLQVNVRADIGLTFESGLRSTLRQDPDVIFVGEIRDSETARTTVQAALTGHLVISTVHTNSALAAVARLEDLGVESFLLADVLQAVVGQRLVRRVCESCATPTETPALTPALTALLPRKGEHRWRRGQGCKACSSTGFRERTGVFEVARTTPALQALIRRGADEQALEEAARAAGFQPLLQHSLEKAAAGVTTVTEALRVIGGEDE